MYHKKTGQHLTIFFTGTEPNVKDWLNNFMLWKRPYKNMAVTWLCHAGFLKEWKKEERYIPDLITADIKSVTIKGLSQGGALAILCHEYIKWNYPLVDVKTIVYGSPRVIGLFNFWKIKKRFADVTRIVNRGDIVTVLPPVILGFVHVGKKIVQGKFTFNLLQSHGGYKIEL